MRKTIVFVLMILCLASVVWAGGTPPGPGTTGTGPTHITLFQREDTMGLGGFKNKGLYNFLLEKFNVDLDVNAVANAPFQERFQVLMMSGDLPDFIAGYGDLDQINRFGTDGMLYECEKLLPVMPNWAQFLQEYSYVRGDITASNGHIYGLNSGYTRPVFYNGFGVKKNMLDSVGFDLSKVDTFDDYYAMLTALKKANGGKPVYDHRSNGQVRRIMTHWMSSVGLTDRRQYYDDAKDTFGYPFADDRARYVVDFLRRLYADGIMHPDIIQHTEDTWEPDMSVLKWAFFADNLGAFGYSNEVRVKLENPAEPTDWRAVKPPKYQGKQYPWRQNYLGEVEIILSAKTQHANKIGEMLDWFRSVEGNTTAKFGIENEDWVMLDGKPVPLWRFQGNNYPLPAPWAAKAKEKTEDKWIQFINTDWGYVKVFGDIGESNFDHLDPNSKTMKDYKPIYAKIYTASPEPQFGFLEEDQEEIMSLRNALDTASHEMIAKIITGLSPMSDWSTLQTQLKSIGLNRYLDLLNKSYQAKKARTK